MNRHTAERISLNYRLDIEGVKRHKKVMKLTTNRGEYALKETILQDKDDERFIHMLRRLERLGYHKLVPILPTQYGEYTITLDNKVYYLMPWVEDEAFESRETKEEKIISEMGIIHRLTAQKDTFKKDLFEQSTKQLLKKWDMKRLEIE
ncbi:MAG TPA: spore coat protein YsxE, partial [Bacilli bacterium]|nr:spore coat protein YsxE [Bacilli bacterium]